MTYKTEITQTATGYSAYVPDLPGCAAAGETEEETLALIHEAIEFHLEGLHRRANATLPLVSPFSVGVSSVGIPSNTEVVNDRVSLPDSQTYLTAVAR